MWTGPVITASGENVVPTDGFSVPLGLGVRLPYVGSLYDVDGGYEVGYSAEMCTRLDTKDIWHCEGTLIDVYECKGQLAISGVYSDANMSGEYVITGGTGDYLGAKGVIYDTFDSYTGYTLRRIVIHQLTDWLTSFIRLVFSYPRTSFVNDLGKRTF